LRAIYPEYNWEQQLDKRSNWKTIENQRAFFDKVASTLNIQKPEDWYSVSVDTVYKMGGSFIRYYNGSLLRGIMV
jgi:hypothetical protein